MCWMRGTVQLRGRSAKGGGSGGACGGCMGPCNCEGEAQRAGRYLLLVVVVGMALCLAGMLRRLRGLRELGGRAEGGGTRNTGLKSRGGL